MFRAVTSIVSTLSGFVAKWPPALAPVSSSPSKIPYGGFSPVRLQTDTDLQRRPSSASKLIRRLQRLSRTPMALSAFIRVPLTPRASPEALGSPTGYAVPPAHRLLWPHLRLSSPPDRLFSSSVALTPRLLTRGMRGSPIYSTRLSLRAASRTPTPWTTALNRFYVASYGLRLIRSGSAVANYALRNQHSRVTRQQTFLNDAARRIACRPPATAFTIKLSPCKSPFHDVDYNYAGIRSIPATGLPPARHAALWAANGYHGFKIVFSYPCPSV